MVSGVVCDGVGDSLVSASTPVGSGSAKLASGVGLNDGVIGGDDAASTLEASGDAAMVAPVAAAVVGLATGMPAPFGADSPVPSDASAQMRSPATTNGSFERRRRRR